MNTSSWKDLLFPLLRSRDGIIRLALTIVLFLSFSFFIPSGTAAQDNLIPMVKRLIAYRFGGDKSVLEDVAKWVAALRSDLTRRREPAEQLAAVLRSDASVDAKEFACRQLVYIADVNEVPALASLLVDDRLAHYALMVLARIPGKEVDQALVDALPPKTKGRTHLEIIDILGERRVVSAISPISMDLLRSPDIDVVSASAIALAKMADTPSADFLKSAYEKAQGGRKMVIGHALLDCGAHLQRAGDTISAASIYELLDRDAAGPVLRAGSLRGIVQINGVKALPQVIAALGDDGTPRQSEAARLARYLSGKMVTERLAETLPKSSVRGQLLILEVLADRGDAIAASGVNAATASSNSAVRSAALRALATVGDAAAVPVLLKAASEAGADRDNARNSLSRLRGANVDSRLAAAVETGAPAMRVEAIRALGARGITTSVPQLLKAARVREKTVSASALRVLRDMATVAELPALIDILLATPAGSRDDAVETVAEVARRGMTESQRTGTLIAKFKASRKPGDQLDLMTILAQVGGPQALIAVRSTSGSSSPEVRSAGLHALAEWSTDEPMPDLLRVVRASQIPSERAVALRGYIRMIGMDEQRPPDIAVALYRDAGALSKGPEESRLILADIAKIRSFQALEFAASFMRDAAVRGEAELAVVEIARTAAGAFPEKTRALLDPIARDSSNEIARTKARETLALIGKFGDFVTAWEVSPAYQRAGADYSKLFDTSFPPEDPTVAKAVPWPLMPAGGAADQPWLLDLLATLGGEQRVAYLRTAVWSDSARDLVLELGSDDGLKVWWNGAVVLANNTARAVAPGQEKVKLQAKPGWNQLLLKVTQNVMGWGAVARFRNPDGSLVTGLKYSVPSAMVK